MKQFLIFLLLIAISISSLAQDIIPLSVNSSLEDTYNSFEGVHLFKHTLENDELNSEPVTVSLNEDFLCISDKCFAISSTIYFIETETDEMTIFCFRLDDEVLCIITSIDGKIATIDILYRDNTFVEYINNLQ